RRGLAFRDPQGTWASGSPERRSSRQQPKQYGIASVSVQQYCRSAAGARGELGDRPVRPTATRYGLDAAYNDARRLDWCSETRYFRSKQSDVPREDVDSERFPSSAHEVRPTLI